MDKKIKLTQYEKEIEDMLIKNYSGASLTPEMKRMHEETARNTLKKMHSIRLNPDDIDKIKSKAEESGVPYQTLVSALIHQYAIGKIKIEI